jgi:hypothetical protein
MDPTAHQTGTFTATPTSTMTATRTPFCQATPTWTPTMGMTCDPKPYPNPVHGGKVKFHVGGGPYEKITVTIYTISMRKIYKVTLVGSLTEQDVEWALMDDASHVVSNGIYYVSIETDFHGQISRFIEKVLVLR